MEMMYYGFTSDAHNRNVEQLEAAMQRLDKTKITDSRETVRPTAKTTPEAVLDEWVDSILQLQDTARMLQGLS